MHVRKRIWEIVEVADPDDNYSKAFDLFILTLIFLNVLAVIISTVQSVHERYGVFLNAFEIISVVVFSVEYLARIWACTSNSRFRHPIQGRLRYIVTPMALIDAVAIVPFYLPFIGLDLRFVRVLRLLRIVRLAKVGRYSSSLQMMKRVLISKKEELLLTVFVLVLLLVVSACVMYHCETVAQPAVFPDIPSTMWWAVVTLTTVGYGDVYPITPMGKFVAAIMAILGIGMFALPTGILGSGFVEEIERRKNTEKQTACPHCGEVL